MGIGCYQGLFLDKVNPDIDFKDETVVCSM